MSEQLTDEQIERAFVSVLGMQPRTADIAVVQMLGGTPEALAEYIWDHWLGEPDRPKQKDIESVILEAMPEDIAICGEVGHGYYDPAKGCPDCQATE